MTTRKATRTLGSPHDRSGTAGTQDDDDFPVIASNAPGQIDRSLEEAYACLIEGLGEDLDREGLRDTPKRAVRALQYLTRGYQLSLDELVNNALFESSSDELVIVKDLEFYSLCEHHVLPIIGRTHIAYLPDGKVIGVSKLARILDLFAARLQIQERLTRQVAETIESVTGARGVAVVIEARHMCMAMRGVQKQHSTMKTSVMLGAFRDDPRTRSEFLQLIQP
ncbi:MAG: GTP cyclohydrolase I FolE [Thioalkalivibrionaceae bacterium]